MTAGHVSRQKPGSAPDVKYVFVTGGVMSGLGKGITAASLGRLLKDRGLDVTAVKIDPYINVDAGTMNPFQHGEVYVLDDGTEVDLDLGNYERFLNQTMSSQNNITTGKVYREIIQRERDGDYLGSTVQIIPHVVDEIKRRVRDVARGHDVCLIEVGGTVGDIEGMPFYETLRQFHLEEPDDAVVSLHVTLIPYSPAGEQKTKPTQHSVKELRSIGIQPDAIVGRCTDHLHESTREKIALFCDIPEQAVFSNPDTNDLYEVPLILEDEEMDQYVLEYLNLDPPEQQDGSWRSMVTQEPDDEVTIALAGKYDMGDAYMSINEALKHAGMHHNVAVETEWVDTDDMESEHWDRLDTADGVIVPGGFGERGVDGKIQTIQHARENDTPFLGICFGFQLAVVEYARNVCGLADAHTTEVQSETPHPVVTLLPDQQDVEEMGATMRLGAYDTQLKSGTLANEMYGQTTIRERHRHRYEVNLAFLDTLQSSSLTFSGWTDDRQEVLELDQDDHPFFVGTQFHPEYTSRPTAPNPVFRSLIEACI